MTVCSRITPTRACDGDKIKIEMALHLGIRIVKPNAYTTCLKTYKVSNLYLNLLLNLWLV